jgi:hypothetical protein
MTKLEDLIENKIQDFKNIYIYFFQKQKFVSKPTCKVGSAWQKHISQSVSS